MEQVDFADGRRAWAHVLVGGVLRRAAARALRSALVENVNKLLVPENESSSIGMILFPQTLQEQ